MKSFVMRIPFHTVFVLAVLMLMCCALSAQQASNPAAIAPHVRLMAARSIYIEHAGALLPNDVIGSAFQGWGRYIVVADPAHADLIVSINAPVSDSGVSVGAGDNRRGAPPPASHNASSSDTSQIFLSILDAHDGVVLWRSSERPKSSMKAKQREDNVVDASLRLFRRFRSVIEPEPAP